MSARSWVICACVLSIAPWAAAEKLPGAIPITTRSPAALAAFQEGQRKAINFDTTPALTQLQQAVKLDPTFALATAWLGKVKGGHSGLALCEKAVKLAAGLSEAEKLSVNILLLEQRGDEEKMRSLKRELAELAPRDWFAQFQEGVQSFYDHKSQGALVFLNRAVAIDPNRPEAYNYLGYTEAQQGQFEGGISHLRKMVSLEPNEANAHDSLGEVLLLAGQFDEAERSFGRATALQPDLWMSWAGVAYARFFHRDFEGGRKAMQLAMKSKLTPFARVACELLIAWSYELSGNFDEALKAVDQVQEESRRKKVDYGVARAATDRAEIQLFSREVPRVDAVAVAAQKAIELASTLHISGQERNDLTRRSQRAQLQAASLRHDRAAVRAAAQALEEAFAQAPSSEELRSAAHFARGLLADELGDPKKAMAELSLCQDPDYVCRLALAELQERSGETSAAQHTRGLLLEANTRDNLHRGESPIYLAVRARLAARRP